MNWNTEQVSSGLNLYIIFVLLFPCLVDNGTICLVHRGSFSMATPDADVGILCIRHRFPVSLLRDLCKRQDYQLGQVVLSPWHCDLELASHLVLLCNPAISRSKAPARAPRSRHSRAPIFLALASRKCETKRSRQS